jgi:hypothetical protein
MDNYQSKAKITSIKATSRASIKIRDNFYTLEYSEERVIPDLPDVDIIKEKEILWDAVNAEVDAQIEDVIKSFK